MNDLIATMKATADNNNEQGARTAENNAAQISEAVAAFREIIDAHNAATKKTFADIQTLLNESETYLQLMEDAENSLSQAAELVKQSTAQLTRNLFETAAQMNTLATANQTTRENLAALSERLATFMKNFNVIANEFERSTNIIRDSLDNYNGKISDGLTNALTQFDKSVNIAPGVLNELLEEFNDTVVGYVKQKRRLFIMRRRTPQFDTPAPDTFTVSISDLMSGLLAIFILVLSYFELHAGDRATYAKRRNPRGAVALHVTRT